MTAGQLRIGIVGLGIDGLTLALALRQLGLAADVYEQALSLREIGAAAGLTANGTRELERLGYLDAIAALSTEPSELIWRGWRDGRRVAVFPIAPAPCRSWRRPEAPRNRLTTQAGDSWGLARRDANCQLKFRS
jgi:hypothetical protein